MLRGLHPIGSTPEMPLPLRYIPEPLPTGDRTTERFVLRPFRRRDAAPLFRAVSASQEELAEYLPWAARTYTKTSAAAFIRDSMRSWKEAKAYDFTVRRPEEPDRHLGNVSIWHLSRAYRNGEIGYWIRTDATGLGIATEATGEALRIGFVELGMHRLTLRIAVGNAPSERVAEKLGFTREGVLREEIRVGGRWMDHSLWSLLDHEYQRAGRQRSSSRN